MDYELLRKTLERKRKKLKTLTLEQMGIVGFFSGFIGLLLGEFYTNALGSLVWQIANVFIYAIIGASIGYFTSKSKIEDLQVDILVLEYIEKSQSI